ncbi:MAG: RNA polymerase sigma factor [Gammaproteobacteria bacterium]
MVTRDQFAQWIDAYHPALYRHALWMLGETELAADLVQETYYQAWKGRAGLRDASKAYSWLLAILRRGAFQEYGRAGRRRTGLRELGMRQAQVSAGDTAALLDLADAFRCLTPNHRDLLLLSVLHGMSYAEIGAMLNIPTGTVMSRLSRARAELARALAQTEPSGGKIVPLPMTRIR